MLSYLYTNIFYKKNSVSFLLEIQFSPFHLHQACSGVEKKCSHFSGGNMGSSNRCVSFTKRLFASVRFNDFFGLFFQPPHIWSSCWNSQLFEFGARQSRSLALILIVQCWEVLSFSSYFLWTARNKCLLFYFFHSVVWWSILSFVVMKYMGSLSIPSSKINALWTYFISE